jgi:hypothetical protein
MIGGTGAWDDFSSASIAARSSLVDSAGISVPNARFVARLLGIYLLCLVPLNWVVFRTMRKVEWAWYAAPTIAVIGAIAVIRLAQLDIGFVRSRTEIAVIETQPAYDRAHVTRYTGLYTSLSTGYDVTFPDATSVALPFSSDPSADELRLAEEKTIDFRQHRQSSLHGLPIASNSTGLVHCEQMIPLDGPITLDDDGTSVVTNRSTWTLQSAILVQRDADHFQMWLLGPIAANATAQIPEQAATDEELEEFLEQTSVTSVTAPKGEVSLRQLYRLALEPRHLNDGDLRLIAWTDAEIEGVSISPASNQRTVRALIINHLGYGHGREPAADANLLEEFKVAEDDLFAAPDREEPTER